MAITGTDAMYYTAVDLEKLTEFYSKVLGASPSVRMERISEWAFPDDTAFGLYAAGTKTPGRSGSIMFAVDDMAAAAKLAREAGARMEGDDQATETPFCTMMFAFDPEGNQFILHKRKV